MLGALALHPAEAQQLGYKLLGSLGIDAGAQPPPGLAVVDQSIHFGSSQLRDREGNVVPIEGLRMTAAGSALGFSYTSKTRAAPYLTFALGVPVASIHVSADNPAASLNGLGFADLAVQPIKVGWRQRRFDVVTGYLVYAPTGHFEPRGGANLGHGYWTHQLSVGGAVHADSARKFRESALASYEINTRMRGIDIRRGDMLQLQGGAGAAVRRIFTIGLAGYALWQATPDRGTDIPPVLREQRTRVFGLGPEVDLTIPRWKTGVSLRVEREFGVRSRPQGQVIAMSVSYLAWGGTR
jgi:hypothetical protein